MTIEWYDIVGTSGVTIILVAYFLLQTKWLKSVTSAVRAELTPTSRSTRGAIAKVFLFIILD